MDKFLIDPPDNITIDNVTVPQENKTVIPTGPPPVETPVETLSMESLTIPKESTNVETGPPESVIKDSIDEPISITIPDSQETVDESLTGESLLPIENVFIKEPVRFSLTRWIIWILALTLFIVIAIYYSIKYALHSSGYLIKKNAKGYKISLEEMKTDIKNWLRDWVERIRDWNENLGSKTNQFFFRQHVDKGTFKATKYKIPKNLITSIPKA